MTVLISMGGLAVAAVSTMLVSLHLHGTSQSAAIHDVLLAVGLAMLVGAVALLSLRRSFALMAAGSLALAEG